MSENTGTPGRTRRRVVRSAGPPAGNARQTEIVTETSAADRVRAATAADASAEADTVRLDAAEVEKARAASAADADTVRSAGADAETVRTKSPARDEHAAADTVRLGAADADTVRLATAAAPVTSADTTGKKSGRLGWLGWIAAVVAVLSVLVLLGSGGFFVYHQRHADTLDARRADYTQTAKQAVLNLTNIKDDTAPQDIDRVLAVASGQLKAEYSERKDAYAQVVQQAKVKASGEIIETAIESEDDHSARVLIAAKQTLTNAASADPQQRYYRFRVTVARGDDGHLTASQVEFVA
ncbi:hypothetical protein [Nocardia sp. N2S4-5]|uniref:hypothetical protein n=1 Tax=Nocardia sp. N2S4-5 TaxID=3351565 RepID=UPI0037D2B958